MITTKHTKSTKEVIQIIFFAILQSFVFFGGQFFVFAGAEFALST